MHNYALYLCLLLVCACGYQSQAEIAQLAAGNPAEVYNTPELKDRSEIFLPSLDAETVNFGITPWGDHEKMQKAYAAFIAYLSEKMGVRVRLMIAQEYRDLVSDIRRGIIHIGSLSPGAYADALDERIDYDTYYVASTQYDGKDFYRGAILAKSEINKLSDLKGKTFAFVEKGSTSGYKYPLAILLARNIDPQKYFNKVFFLGSHPAVAEAVLTGKVDAGATWDGIIEENYGKYPANIKLLMKTDPIPYDAVIVTKKKGKSFAARLQKILKKMTRESTTADNKKALDASQGFPYSGYVVHGTGTYDIVRKTARMISKYKPE